MIKNIDDVVDTIIRLMNVWRGIRDRCYAKNHVSYPYYGARGIKVCKEWLGYKGRRAFVKWALKNGYQTGLDVSRKNTYGSYSPKNCKFETRKINCRNKTNNRKLTYAGETKCVAAWGDDSRCKVHSAQFQQRIRFGWPIDQALSIPLGASTSGKRGAS